VSVGIVKFYNPERGYGFILDDHGRDIFVHNSAVKHAGLHDLKPGQHITFDLKPRDTRVPRAVNLKIVD
jgi:CspA family cold shock protein